MVSEVVILFVLILVNAFFSASEIALISLNDNKMKMMADEGNKKAKMIINLLSEPSRFLATIQIGITLAGFLASAFAAERFSGKLSSYLFSLGLPIKEDVLATISLVVITLVLSYFTLVLGELVPKRLALNKADAISMIAVRPILFLSKLTFPFVKFLTGSTNVAVRLFGVNPHEEEENITEEEIRMMIDVGKEKGTIRESEKVMIHNVFEFDNKYASDIFTHRIEIVAIPADADLQKTIEIAYSEKYTRYPVYVGSIDRVIGILHVKDLLRYLGNSTTKPFYLPELLHEPYFVPETIKTDHLFKDMQMNNIQMAIVIDEYGGTAGIVTIEDLVEEIVGNIFDEYDTPQLEEEEIKILNPTTYLIEGTTSLDDVKEILKADLPVDEYETLNGFVLGKLGYFPTPGEQPYIEFDHCIFKVEEMSERRIEKIKVIIESNDARLI